MAFERSCFFLFFFFLAVGLASSSPAYISYDVLKVHMLGGRGLLETFLVKDNCPIDFEKEDFSPLTGQCKGPTYNPLTCCNGFKQIACRHPEEINDLDNGCATGLFYIINKHFPLDLFDNICKEGKEGLECAKTTGPAINKPRGTA
ncbi:hypothetical protein K7X08_032852 [Anisodus acutangulus]|uniref:GPI-anchored protein LLG1-like domain-containing protein n=1 Tax=Anisodus acutangulus TaxID=402998 RepID=A0A9Q1M1L9_9SOLA|nr:hypothetical protein K7X08_032852 [Anisodus acutangulus]